MSSFVRRIQRQQVGTKASFVIIDDKGHYVEAGPRQKFYRGRGKMLGVTNPKAADLLARQRREKRRAA